MEWLTFLKFLSEAENADTLAELQQQVNQLGQVHNAFVDGTMALIGLLGVCIVGIGIGMIISTTSNARKIKRLEAKLDKLIPLIEKTTGVQII